MATTTLPIPLVTLTVGSRDFGPVPVDDTVVRATLTVDRTVVNGGVQGLNGQPDTTTIQIGIYESDDNGASWQFRAAAGLIGGLYPSNQAGDPYLVSNVSVDLNPVTGRRVKATVEVAGASVAVAGSLVIQ
jgi:hypothetical protein